MTLKLVPIKMENDADKKHFKEVAELIMSKGWTRLLIYFDDGTELFTNELVEEHQHDQTEKK